MTPPIQGIRLLLWLPAALSFGQAAVAGWHVEQRIVGPPGGFDYLSVDSAAQRLFIAREYGVMAVDLASGRVIDRLAPGHDDSAALILPGTPELLSTNWGTATATILDRRTGAVRAVVATGRGPDAAVYDADERLAYVMNTESRDVSVIDVAAARTVATIPLGTKPEAGVLDGRGQLFVNLEEKAQVAVIDTHQRRVTRTLGLPGCVEPTAVTFDSVTGLLISACHNGVAKLVHAETGADRGSLAVGRDADGAVFDSRRRLLFVPSADGVLTIYRLDTEGHALLVASLSTEKGARTAALDEGSGKLYLASDGGTGHRSFGILVIAP